MLRIEAGPAGPPLTDECRAVYFMIADAQGPHPESVGLDTVSSPGKKLAGNVAGLRPARVDNFAYRIVYEIDDADCIIIVHAILNRGAVYANLARRA